MFTSQVMLRQAISITAGGHKLQSSKLVFYVSFNSQGHTETGPQLYKSQTPTEVTACY